MGYPVKVNAEKHAKMAGAGNGKSADWISPNKVKVFKVLFDRIKAHIGSYEGARAFIGIGGSGLDGLQKGKISAFNGRKILDAYNNILRKD